MGRSRAVAALTSTGSAPVNRSSARTHGSVSAGETEHSTAPTGRLQRWARLSPSSLRVSSSAVAGREVTRQKPARSAPAKSPTTVSLFPTSTASNPLGFAGTAVRVRGAARAATRCFRVSGTQNLLLGLARPAAPGDQIRQADADEVQADHRDPHDDLGADDVTRRDDGGRQEREHDRVPPLPQQE